MSILNNEIRVGRFTSSQIYRLVGAGSRDMTAEELAMRPKSGKGSSVKTIADPLILSATAQEYIAEKNAEIELGRSLTIEKQGRSALWGHFHEQRVHDILPPSYRLIGKKTEAHPKYPFWAGSPDNDCKSLSIVGDIKCYEPKKFKEYVDCLILCVVNGIDLFKENFPQEYWQLISNACILDMDKISPIVYMPYFSELEEIRQSVRDLEDEDDKRKYGFIANAHYNELPWLPDGGRYKNLNQFVFEAPKEDKDFLTGMVLMAAQKLVPLQ